MMAREDTATGERPRAGASREEIHLPGPTVVPLVTGIGITIALVGLILNWFIVGAGVLITLGAILRWIRDTRQDVAHLPR